MIQAIVVLTLTIGGTLALIVWDPARKHPKHHLGGVNGRS